MTTEHQARAKLRALCRKQDELITALEKQIGIKDRTIAVQAEQIEAGNELARRFDTFVRDAKDSKALDMRTHALLVETIARGGR